MIVYVNDIAVKTYYGAKVKSAIWAYFRDHNIPLKTEVKEIKDAYGNRIDKDGAIRANSKIYIKL
jgi:hypothetical protein